MRDAFQLAVIVWKASLIVTAGCFALLLTPMLWGFKPDPKLTVGATLGAVACFLPIGAATVWILRKLRTVYAQREARAVSIAFGLFTPISLLISILVPIPGGYALAAPAVPKFLGLIGYLVGTSVTTALLSFLVCALTLRVTRLTITVEQIN
jgi:hypothetical protein